jgi:hypothetical protein
MLEESLHSVIPLSDTTKILFNTYGKGSVKILALTTSPAGIIR